MLQEGDETVKSPYRIHEYLGYTIIPCECDKLPYKRWWIRTYHDRTGQPWAESESHHAYTLPEARSYIWEMRRREP